MTFRGAKPELTEYLRRLDMWRNEVPERAGRFHRQVESLSQEIDEQLSKWWPWLGGTERQQLRHRVDRLGNVAGRLGKLIQEAGRLGENVELLENRTRDIEPALVDWLRRNCREWKVGLEDLGKHIDRASELAQEEKALVSIRAALEAHEQAVGLLKKVAEARRDLGGVDIAELEVRLPELTDRLETEGPTDPWIEEFRTFLEPFEKALEAKASPPPVLQSVASMLNELRAWARHLDTLHEVKILEEKKGFYAVEWTRRNPSEIDDLRREADEHLHRYVESARSLRQEKLDRLNEELQDFFAVCGHQPELEERFDRLKDAHRRLDRPQLHPKWLNDFDQECAFFKAIVENYQIELKEWLDQLSTRLEEGLAELHAKPLSADVKEQIRDLEYETGQLRALRGVEEILRGLRRSQRLERTLDELDRQSRREIQELALTQAELAGRHDRLTALAQKLSFAAEDLGESIAAIDNGSRPLEEARREADLLADRLAEEESRFVEHCRRQVAEHQEAIRATRQLLEQAGRTISQDLPTELPADAELADATEAVRGAATLLDTLEAQLDEEVRAIHEKGREKLRELEAIPPDSLGPGDREDLEQVVEMLRDSLAAPPASPRDHLDLLLDLLDQCRVLLEQLKREEIEADQKLTSLKRRWQELKSAHLRRYLPKVCERVEALIHGIPEPPYDLRQASAQLARAEALFDRLDQQARRLAARDLENAVTGLRRQSAKISDEAVKSRIDELLAAVDRFDHRKLPPPTLRMKIRGALRGAREGASRS